MSPLLQFVLVAVAVIGAALYLGWRARASLRGTGGGCGSCGSAMSDRHQGPRRLPAARPRPTGGRRDTPG